MAVTEEQQNELEVLKAKRAQLLLQQQQSQASDSQLIQDLAGQRPQPFLPRPRADTPANQLEFLKRRRADLLLQQQGKTPEQIQFVLDVNRKTRAAPVGRTVGGIAGALAVPAAINLIPGFAALPEEIVTVPLALMKAAKTIAPIAGAGIGGAAGQSLQTGIEEKRLLTEGEFLKAFGTEAAFEAGGRSFTRGVKFAFSPFIKQAIPEAAEITAKYGDAGRFLTPSQMDKRLSLNVGEEIVKGGFGSKDIFGDLLAKKATAAQVHAEVLLDNMAGGVARLGKEQIGREVAEGFARPTGFVFRSIDDVVGGLYQRLDDLTGATVKPVLGPVVEGGTGLRSGRRIVGRRLAGQLSPGFQELEQFVPAGVSTRKLKRFWIDELKKNRLALKQGRKGAFTLTTAAVREGESVIRDLADNVPHKTMRDIRSRVLRDIRKLHRDVGQDEALLKKFEQVTFDTLTDPAAIKGAPREVKNLFNNTRELYKSLRGGIESTFPEQVAKRLVKNPSRVVAEFLPQGNPKAIKQFRQSLLEPIQGRPSAQGRILWNQVRTAWFADAVENATRGEVIKPGIFEGALRTMTPAAVKELVPDAIGKQQLQGIRTLLRAMSKKPSAGASLFIRSGQVGGLFMLYNGTKEGDFLQVGAGGALVAGPRFLAKMAGNALGRKLLTSGINLRPGASSLVPIVARLVNLSRKIDRQEQRSSKTGQALKRVREAQQAVPKGQQFRLGGLRVR